MSFGVIESLLCYHKHSSYRIRRSVYFSLGNILASNDTIVNHFCTFHSYFLPTLLETIQNDTHFIVKLFIYYN